MIKKHTKKLRLTFESPNSLALKKVNHTTTKIFCDSFRKENEWLWSEWQKVRLDFCIVCLTQNRYKKNQEINFFTIRDSSAFKKSFITFVETVGRSDDGTFHWNFLISKKNKRSSGVFVFGAWKLDEKSINWQNKWTMWDRKIHANECLRRKKHWSKIPM
jgi:hypothetical protein